MSNTLEPDQLPSRRQLTSRAEVDSSPPRPPPPRAPPQPQPSCTFVWVTLKPASSWSWVLVLSRQVDKCSCCSAPPASDKSSLWRWLDAFSSHVICCSHEPHVGDRQWDTYELEEKCRKGCRRHFLLWNYHGLNQHLLPDTYHKYFQSDPVRHKDIFTVVDNISTCM